MNKHMSQLSVVLLLLSLIYFVTCGTELTDAITNLVVAESPYIVSEPVYYDTSVTIEPGVIITFSGASSLLFQEGAILTAEGTEQQKILFTTVPEDDSWDGLVLMEATLAHVIIENVQGIALDLFGDFQAESIEVRNVTGTAMRIHSTLNLGLSNSSIEATGKCTDFDLDWEIPFIVTVTDSSFVCELGSSITQYQGEQVWARNIFVGDVYVNARGDFSDPVEIFQFEENTVNGVFHLVAQDIEIIVSFNVFDGSTVDKSVDKAMKLHSAAATFTFANNTVTNYDITGTILELKPDCGPASPMIIHDNTISSVTAREIVYFAKPMCQDISFKNNRIIEPTAEVVYSIYTETLVMKRNAIIDPVVTYLLQTPTSDMLVDVTENYWGTTDYEVIQPKVRDILMEQTFDYGPARYSPFCDEEFNCTLTAPKYIFLGELGDCFLNESEYVFPYSVYSSCVFQMENAGTFKFGVNTSMIIAQSLSLSGTDLKQLIPMEPDSTWNGIVFKSGSGLLGNVFMVGATGGKSGCAISYNGTSALDVTSGSQIHALNDGICSPPDKHSLNVRVLSASSVIAARDAIVSGGRVRLISSTIRAGRNGIIGAMGLLQIQSSSIFAQRGVIFNPLYSSSSVIVQETSFEGAEVALSFEGTDTASNVFIVDNTFTGCGSMIYFSTTEATCDSLWGTLTFSIERNNFMDSDNAGNVVDINIPDDPSLLDKEYSVKCLLNFKDNIFYNVTARSAVFSVNAYGVDFKYNTLDSVEGTLINYSYASRAEKVLNCSANFFGTLDKRVLDERTIDNKDNEEFGHVIFNPVLYEPYSTILFDLEAECYYNGTECLRDFECFGVGADEFGVCNGGRCVAPDVCVCTGYYSGSNCTILECPDRYLEPNCEPIQCYNIDFNNETSCNGNGDCVAPDNCTCYSGYTGPDCSIFDCFDINVCSSNGMCINLDNCSCNEGYTGDQCQFVLPKLDNVTTVYNSTELDSFLPFSDGSIILGFISYDRDEYWIAQYFIEEDLTLRLMSLPSEFKMTYSGQGDQVYVATSSLVYVLSVSTNTSEVFAGGGDSSYPESHALTLNFTSISGIDANSEGTILVYEREDIDEWTGYLTLVFIQTSNQSTHKIVLSKDTSPTDFNSRDIRWYDGYYIARYNQSPTAVVRRFWNSTTVVFGSEDNLGGQPVDGALGDVAVFEQMNAFDFNPYNRFAAIDWSLLRLVDLRTRHVSSLSVGLAVIYSVRFDLNEESVVYVAGRTGFGDLLLQQVHINYPDCSTNCSGHGECVRGLCECESGYQGSPTCDTYSCDRIECLGQCIGPNLCDYVEPSTSPFESTLDVSPSATESELRDSMDPIHSEVSSEVSTSIFSSVFSSESEMTSSESSTSSEVSASVFGSVFSSESEVTSASTSASDSGDSNSISLHTSEMLSVSPSFSSEQSQYRIEINAENEYELCSDIDIQVTILDQNEDILSVSFNWTLRKIGRFSDVLYEGFDTNQPNLPVLPANNYTLTVKATVGGQEVESTASFAVTDRFQLLLDKSLVTMRRSNELLLNSVGSIPSCILQSTVVYNWTVTNSGNELVRTDNKQAFRISPFSLEYGSYSVKLLVSSDIVSYSAIAFVNVTSSAPTVRILGGDVVIGTRSNTFQAAAGDPDNVEAIGIFAWNCSIIQGTTACPDTISTSSSIYQFNVTGTGTFELSVQFRTSDNRVAKDTILITVTAERVPSISISTVIPRRVSKSQKLMVEAKIAPVSDLSQINIRWLLREEGQNTNILAQNSLLSKTDKRTLVFIPTALLEGINYYVQVEAKYRNSNATSYSRVLISLVSSPSGGTFTITPSTGFELNTVFALSAQNWETEPDALPLSYSFEFNLSNRFVPIKLMDLSNSFTAQLIRNNGQDLIVKCRIRNYYGAEVSLLRTITVQEQTPTNVTQFIDTLLAEIGNGNSYKLVFASKLLAAESDSERTASLLSLIQQSIDSQDIEGVLIQKVTALSLITKNNPIAKIPSVTYVPNLLGNITLASDSEIFSIVADVISNSLLIADNSTDSTLTAASMINSLSQLATRSISVGESAINVTSDAISMSILKDFGSDLQQTTVSDNYGSVYIPSTNSLNSVQDNLLSVEYITFGITTIGLWNNRNQNLSSSITSFKLLDANSNKVTFEADSNDPLIITLSRSGELDLQENATLVCQYLNDYGVDENEWKVDGCVLNVTTADYIVCHCNHTTSFAAFIQYTQEEISEPLEPVERGVYYVGLIAYSIYFLLCLALFLVLLSQFNKQPVRSRSFGPYVMLLALAVECALSVARYAILSSNNRDANVLNILGNVIMFVSNPLAIVSLFIFFWQMIRYFLMKHIYHIMGVSKGNASGKKLLLFKAFASRLVFIILSATVYVLTLVYFLTYSVVQLSTRSKLTEKIARDNTTALSVSYAGIMLIFALGIVVGFVWDMIVIPLQINKYEKQIVQMSKSDTVIIGTSSKKEVSLMDIIRPLHYHFIKDDPLYFRSNSVFMVLSMLACFVSFAIGIANRFQTKSDSSPVLIVALIFDLIYTALRIVAYGGFICVIRLVTLVKNRNNPFSELGTTPMNVSLDSDIRDQMEQVINSPVGQQLLKVFCIKEFSLENLMAYLMLKDINAEWLHLPNHGKEDIVDSLVQRFIKSGAQFEVNIPGPTKKAVLTLHANINETSLSDQLKTFQKLINALLTNLSDTFSRFTETKEYKQLLAVQSMNSALEAAMDEAPVRIKWFSTDIELTNSTQ